MWNQENNKIVCRYRILGWSSHFTSHAKEYNSAHCWARSPDPWYRVCRLTISHYMLNFSWSYHDWQGRTSPTSLRSSAIYGGLTGTLVGLIATPIWMIYDTRNMNQTQLYDRLVRVLCPKIMTNSAKTKQQTLYTDAVDFASIQRALSIALPAPAHSLARLNLWDRELATLPSRTFSSQSFQCVPSLMSRII